MKFAFSRMANRLTGISTPFFGASWNPAELDVDLANELITFLEDRRMLFMAICLGKPALCDRVGNANSGGAVDARFTCGSSESAR